MNDDLDLLLGLEEGNGEPNPDGNDPSLLTNLPNDSQGGDNSNPEPPTEPDPQNQDGNNPDPSNPIATEQFDLITEALKARGFKDPNNIKIENDFGAIVTKSFDELTNEEKLQILNTSPNEDYDLSKDEIQLISFMREHELSQEEMINYYKQQGIQEYLDNNVQFSVDNLSDEEILAFDLKERYEDWTDEEIHDEVERAKENPNLFAKKVERLREIYKELEQQQLEEQNNQNNQQVTTEEQQQFLNSFKEAGNKYKNFSGVDLEDRDLTSTYDYAFKPTLNGASKLAIDLNNPEKLFKMAFFMAHGDELLQNLHTAYMSELSKKDKEIQNLKNPSNPKGNNKPSPKSNVTVKSTSVPSDEDDLSMLFKLKQ